MTTEKTSSTAKKPVVKKVAKKSVVKKEKKLYIAFGPVEYDKGQYDVHIAATVEEATDPDVFYDTPKHKIIVLDVSNFLPRLKEKEEHIDVIHVFDDRS